MNIVMNEPKDPEENKFNFWTELILVVAAPVISIIGQVITDSLARKHEEKMARLYPHQKEEDSEEQSYHEFVNKNKRKQ